MQLERNDCDGWELDVAVALGSGRRWWSGSILGTTHRCVSPEVRFLGVYPVCFLKSAEVVWNEEVAAVRKRGVRKPSVWWELWGGIVRRSGVSVPNIEQGSIDWHCCQ